MPVILKIDQLTKRFGGLTAVNNLSIEVEENTIHALIGPNGSGKTTAINLISGILKQDSGAIAFQGEDISSLPAYKITRKGISRTYQNLKLFPSMKVIENIMVGGHLHTDAGLLEFLFNPVLANKEEKALREKAEGVLEFIGLCHASEDYVNNLPYGRQKMVEIGRALMGEPKLILLDEPAAGLNPAERGDLIELLKKVFESGIQLFLIEHNMDVVMNISHKISVLNFGTKIAEGKPSEIQNNDDVIKAYLGDKYKKVSHQAAR